MVNCKRVMLRAGAELCPDCPIRKNGHKADTEIDFAQINDYLIKNANNKLFFEFFNKNFN